MRWITIITILFTLGACSSDSKPSKDVIEAHQEHYIDSIYVDTTAIVQDLDTLKNDSI